MKYVEEGRVIAEGSGVLGVVLDYLEGNQGVILNEIDTHYEWRDYPRNTDYEVCELGLVRNKIQNNLLQMSLKRDYTLGDKGAWRLRVTIPNIGTVKVSHVVAETFIDKPIEVDGEESKVLGHKNDIPVDNRVDNLAWITDSQNKTVDWVLRDIVRNGLNITQVDTVYKTILGVLEDNYGGDFEVDELAEEDMNEVQNIFTPDDVYRRTIGDIYNYKKNGTGVLARLQVVNGKFIL